MNSIAEQNWVHQYWSAPVFFCPQKLLTYCMVESRAGGFDCVSKETTVSGYMYTNIWNSKGVGILTLMMTKTRTGTTSSAETTLSEEDSRLTINEATRLTQRSLSEGVLYAASIFSSLWAGGHGHSPRCDFGILRSRWDGVTTAANREIWSRSTLET